jgi:CheY-like chemotaxis protein
MLYPLSYGGSAAARTGPRANGTEQPYQPAPPPRTTPTEAQAPPATTSPAGQTAATATTGKTRRGTVHTSGRTADSLAPVTQALGRVLVVDDDEVIRQLIAVNLTLEGFDVSTAVDGQDCLDKVGSISPQVITLDVMMPRLDGWVTAGELRKNPDTSHIKVVLITARAQEDDKQRGHQIGVDAYLTKPFDPGEMIRVVRELAGAPPTALG